MNATGTGAQPLPQPSGLGKNLLRELLPLAVALLVFAAAEWYVLTQGWLLGTWILAAFLAFHGLIHLMFLSPKPPEAAAGGMSYPFDPTRSWPVTRLGVGAAAVRGLAAGLSVIVAVGFILAGLATVGLIVPTDWWAGLIVGASVLSLALFALTFSPSLALGIAIDLVLLWLVWSGAWIPINA